MTAPSLSPVLRPKQVKPVFPGFEVKPVKPSRTLPHDVTDSPVLRPNRSNRRCRRVSDLPPSLDAFESFARTRHTGRLLDSPSSSPTWPTPSSSSCTLALPCTMWIAQPPRVPRSRPTRIHPSPSWSLGRNVSPHRAYSRPSFTTVLQHKSLTPSTNMPNSTPAHHEPRDTSTPYDVINHSSSKGELHKKKRNTNTEGEAETENTMMRQIKKNLRGRRESRKEVRS